MDKLNLKKKPKQDSEVKATTDKEEWDNLLREQQKSAQRLSMSIQRTGGTTEQSSQSSRPQPSQEPKLPEAPKPSPSQPSAQASTSNSSNAASGSQATETSADKKSSDKSQKRRSRLSIFKASKNKWTPAVLVMLPSFSH